MTTSEILTLARAKLLEEGADIITDARLLIYANLAHKDVIKKAFPNNAIEQATITFTSGVGDLPSDFGTLYTDAYDSDTNMFPEVSIADYIRYSANGINCVTIEGGEIKVSPTDTATLTIKYYPTYTALTSVVNPTIDEYLHEPIVYGIIYRAFEDLQDPELALFYENKFKTMLEDKLSTLSNYEEDGTRGVMFNGINLFGGGNNNNPDRW